nr:Chain E, SLAIN motif-containing protein 2 [Homo sapiens]3RDV_F Chain F, SLAIN motif-containing protein 2 [Homo sapiens]3RDV_G Chain G, SLAIN motif-containing protein 2 [Homo sapiens]3RDV_H Chain H, SLAIN motif-containing protein 2 [Homo sapiens]
DSWKDGCY